MWLKVLENAWTAALGSWKVMMVAARFGKKTRFWNRTSLLLSGMSVVKTLVVEQTSKPLREDSIYLWSENCWKNPPGFLHLPSADFHSSFHSEGGGRRLVLLISSLSYPFLHSAEGLILPSSWAFVSGKKTKSSRKTLLREDGKEDFERTGVHWGGVLCQTRAWWGMKTRNMSRVIWPSHCPSPWIDQTSFSSFV